MSAANREITLFSLKRRERSGECKNIQKRIKERFRHNNLTSNRVCGKFISIACDNNRPRRSVNYRVPLNTII